MYYGARPFYPPAYVYRPVYGPAFRPAVGYASPAGYRNNYNNVRVNNVNVNVNNNNNYYNRFNNNQNLRTAAAPEVRLRIRRTEGTTTRAGNTATAGPRRNWKGQSTYAGARGREIRLRRPVRTPALSPPIARQQGQQTLRNVPIVATTAHHAAAQPPGEHGRNTNAATQAADEPPGYSPHRGRRRRRRLNKQRRETTRSPAPKLLAAATFNAPPVLVVTPARVHARFPRQARGNVRQICTERRLEGDAEGASHEASTPVCGCIADHSQGVRSNKKDRAPNRL